jgi:predicted RecB family nuclease
MLINAELLLQYQRCKRRPYLDVHEDRKQRDATSELVQKLQQDKIAHQKSILKKWTYEQPIFPPGNWQAGQVATLELMQRGVECIHQGVMLVSESDIDWLPLELTDTEGDTIENIHFSPKYKQYTLLSRPDLLVKKPGKSRFGDWMYVPVDIELGKRPKQEYQVVVAYHAQILATVQQAQPETAKLMLRGRDTAHSVDLLKWVPQMQRILLECMENLSYSQAPEVFISRQKCTLCQWYSSCYATAQSQKHLSLLPGVTPVRYTQLQALDMASLESLAGSRPAILEDLPGFDYDVATKLVLQAQSVIERRPLVFPYIRPQDIIFPAPIEIYFDIEAQPDLNLNYLLGLLVVDNEKNTEKFYSLLAEKPEDEKLVWQQFLDVVGQYPDAPIYHFCVYEVDTVKRLAKLYNTPFASVEPILSRFVDVYEELIQAVALPIESYALKSIAKWLGFEWRDQDASGAKCIYWYDQWLETGDRSLLELIQRYNEDDCRATRGLKDWLANFLESETEG